MKGKNRQANRKASEKPVKIYGIVDPRVGKVRYVGRSTNVAKRHPMRKDGTYIINYDRGKELLIEIVQSGFQPEIKVLETTEFKNRREREDYWISHYGLENLVNRLGGIAKPKPKGLPKTKMNKVKISTKSSIKPSPNLTLYPYGHFLVRLREAKGLSQSEVETSAGLPRQRLYHYEKGRPIPLRHLGLLSTAYGIPARDLIDDESFNKVLSFVKELAGVFGWTAEEMNGGTL